MQDDDMSKHTMTYQIILFANSFGWSVASSWQLILMESCGQLMIKKEKRHSSGRLCELCVRVWRFCSAHEHITP